MTKNETEGRLLEKAELVILKEEADMVLSKFGSQFMFEKDRIEDFISQKQQVNAVD
jgi:hypothetical protein